MRACCKIDEAAVILLYSFWQSESFAAHILTRCGRHFLLLLIDMLEGEEPGYGRTLLLL
jgi:hypothetical protein